MARTIVGRRGLRLEFKPDRNKRDTHEHNIGKSRLCVLLWIGKARQGEPRKFTEVWIDGIHDDLSAFLGHGLGVVDSGIDGGRGSSAQFV